MKAFVSYASKDGTKALEFITVLKTIGYSVSQPYETQRTKKTLTAKSFYESINEDMLSSDLVVLIYSKNYEGSRAFANQAQAIRLHADMAGSTSLLIVVLDQAPMPPEFWSYKVVWANTDFKKGISYFSYLAKNSFKSALPEDEDEENPKSGLAEVAHDVDELADGTEDYPDVRFDSAKQKIRIAAREGTLTLVCGAGISVDAQIPKWDVLLNRLLNKMVARLSSQGSDAIADHEADLEAIKKSSSLIVGRYLKDVLNDDFLPEVRDALYQDSGTTSELIDSIVNLARPRRNYQPLDSIITFNFDDLLEQNLKARQVEHLSIYQEGGRNEMDEIPIYHVHGFLPNDGPITPEMNIVFSEDAYHDQFIDPFSWSNLIQLSKFSQNTCLFIGLSLTDPNLRRLLDVAKRKDPEERTRHVVVQTRSGSSKKSKLVESLKEKDAANLGLATIWLDSFEELPSFLNELTRPSSARR